MQNSYLGFSIDPNFQEVNRRFVLSFKDEYVGERYKQDHLPAAEILMF